MVSDTSLSTRVSLITLDPALASHITATPGTTTAPSISQYASSPRKSTKTPNTDLSRRHIRNNSAPTTALKKRSNSLRRVKNSTELLRQRSTNDSKKNSKVENAIDVRAGRNFTVGNVGTGGILYLTPSAYQSSAQKSSLSSPASARTPVTAPAFLGLENLLPPETQTNPSNQSDPSVYPLSASPHSPPKAFDKRAIVAHHGRSQSFSTVEEHRQSFSASKSRTLRIVIQRPDTARSDNARDSVQDVHEDLSPTLSVPIPHYRIGTFRFSAQGTPVLRGSSFTRGSATPSVATPTIATTRLDQYFHGPPASSLKAFSRMDQTALGQLHPPSSIANGPLSDQISAPSVQPNVFADLSGIYDDPSVVRYCHNVREITAATPARIIAQISSDSFMDYELVSDFFLTFRCYMSTFSVLDYLLARLRWAIGRLEDDGRIIRVRTFAALRHWILNYFMDDFFVDRRLRDRFCDEINKLYTDVKNNPDSGFSDLKLLRDLKRCWNGRCSLCWTQEYFELDGDQDDHLIPGGANYDEYTPQPPVTAVSLHPPTEMPPPEILQGPSTSWFEIPRSSANQHLRKQSILSDHISPSLDSDGSLQASSCFPKSLLRSGAGEETHVKGPHPVSVQLRRKNAPATLHVNTQPGLAPKSLGHRRGASSVDSNREPTPRKVEDEPQSLLIDDGSIIRGLLYSPSAPFVQIVSSSTPSTTELSDSADERTRIRRPQDHSTHGGRNLFGSLRKVLGGKNGADDVAVLSISQPMHEVPGNAHKPQRALKASASHDELGGKSTAPLQRKGEIRIDLLCAAVCQNYEGRFPSKHRVTYGPLYATNMLMPISDQDNAKPGIARGTRRTTAQSGSILIMDDTRPDIPVMSGALRPLNLSELQREGSRYETDMLHPDSFRSDGKMSLDAVATQRSSDVFGEAMHETDSGSSIGSAGKLSSQNATEGPSSPAMTGHAGKAEAPIAETFKHPDLNQAPSSEETPSASREPDLDHPPLMDDNSEVEQASNAGPAHTLRRRPGGDLRRAENVQQLDHTTHHQSFDTASTVSRSPNESMLLMRTDTNRTIRKTAQPPEKVVSMINTHSSQHLRPSFEAAVAGFSDIPDDDDGGLEATLLKLEGRYEKRSPPINQHPIDVAGKRRSLPDLQASSEIDLSRVREGTSQSVHGDSLDMPEKDTRAIPARSYPGGDLTRDITHTVTQVEPSSRRSSIFGLATESVADSEESFGSLPLLKREAGHGSTVPAAAQQQHPQVAYVAPGYFAQDPPQLFHLPKGPPPSGNKNAHGRSLSRPDTADESAKSFLLDEDENLSDLSSDISVDIINYSEVVDRSISPMLAAPGTAISGLEIPAHPLTYASVVNLATPEVDSTVPLPSSSEGKGLDTQMLGRPQEKSKKHGSLGKSITPLTHLPSGPAHLPFVLACDSQVLAQQMTLVEKSALAEVEWSDLVEMRWDSKAAEVLDWVDCLMDWDIRGVDLVITRFNLVVKWVMSEIVLTRDIHERARVITKYIHVAAHARRLHNYATMLQLTIALTSTDCARLTKTWELVSGPDMSLLKHMEMLVQPVRNFHDLRIEMESADPTDGCIPFIGKSRIRFGFWGADNHDRLICS